METNYIPIAAQFVDLKTVKTRSVVQLIFEIDISSADHIIAQLGGFPQPGEPKACAIVQLNPMSTEFPDAITA